MEFGDNFALEQRKARIAITPTCNLRCTYCDKGLGRTALKTGAMEDFRCTNLEEGSIGVDDYMRIMSSIYKIGFKAITFTGGEPMLNKNWPRLVDGAKEIGFNNVSVTTNGSMLNSFLKKNGKLPDSLDLLTVSLDTFNSEQFKIITGAHIQNILSGIKNVKESNPDISIKTNHVVLRSQLSQLKEYIRLCEDYGIEYLKLLNLICKEPNEPAEREFFNTEFVPPKEVLEILDSYNFEIDSKYEFTTKTPKGLTVTLLDSDQTLRSEQCENCPIYCQEGFYTVRVATDGAIRTCVDFKNQLPYVKYSPDSTQEDIDSAVTRITSTMTRVILRNTLDNFCNTYGLLTD